MRGITVDKTGVTPLNTLDGVYTQILSVAIPSNSSPEILSRFHSVVGTIILLRDPLPLRPLAILLQTDPNDVKGALVHFQSIIFLREPENTPRIYHKSFPDFITDVKRCSHDPRSHYYPSFTVSLDHPWFTFTSPLWTSHHSAPVYIRRTPVDFLTG